MYKHYNFASVSFWPPHSDFLLSHLNQTRRENSVIGSVDAFLCRAGI